MLNLFRRRKEEPKRLGNILAELEKEDPIIRYLSSRQEISRLLFYKGHYGWEMTEPSGDHIGEHVRERLESLFSQQVKHYEQNIDKTNPHLPLRQVEYERLNGRVEVTYHLKGNASLHAPRLFLVRDE